jgi:hypothetical protein
MITTSRAPRTQRLLIGAFILSLIIHLFGGALWAHANQLVARIMRRLPEQQLREQEVATSDAIRLEKRTISRPAQRSRARPEPHPVPRAQPPHPIPVTVVSKPAGVRPRVKVAAPAASTDPEIAHRTAHSPPHFGKPDVARSRSAGGAPSSGREAVLSAAQLAQLNAQFSKTIASSHVDLATIQKRTEERPVAVKHYPLQFAGMQANLQRGEGYIEPTTMGQRIGGTVWYYTHYTYMWPDGHLEDDDIPWPFRYPVHHDLFAQHIHLIPLQLPPPGYHLTRPLKPFLTQFLARAGRG